MKLFSHAHATHPDWRFALSLAVAQIEAERQSSPTHGIQTPTLGWLYFTEAYVPHASELLEALQQRWPGTQWVGASGVGIAANGVEYFDEPALALMLCDWPSDCFRVFSGAEPLGPAASFAAATAQVHADPSSEELAELIAEMSARTGSAYVFGGMASGGEAPVHLANGVYRGGLSGLALSTRVRWMSRVTQGCRPVGPARRVTQGLRNVVGSLNGQPALDSLLADLGLNEEQLRQSLPRLRSTLVGMSDDRDELLSHPGQFGIDTRVRHLIGIDLQSRAVAISGPAEEGMQLAFCSRDVMAARRDLVRICSEIREAFEPDMLPREAALALQPDELTHALHPARGIAGAIYISCAGRGGPHFGAPSAELELVRHALGDVPLVGFFAAGEIAHRHLYGYTGVLTVFGAAEAA